ncbi:MAG: type VI secretion system-associated FHA domain protein TagH [Candidatus Competibacteraceae bacterium]
MPLTLTIISTLISAPIPTTTYVVDFGHVAIGRGQDNDWILPDPENVLSRKHCYIEYRNGLYYLTDTSANGVFVNHSTQALGKGQSVLLEDDDIISLGRYDIRVSITLTKLPLADSGGKVRRPAVPTTVISRTPFSFDDALSPTSKRFASAPGSPLPEKINSSASVQESGETHSDAEALFPDELDLAKLLAESEDEPPVPDDVVSEEPDLGALLDAAEPTPVPSFEPESRLPEWNRSGTSDPRTGRAGSEQAPPKELNSLFSDIPEFTTPVAAPPVPTGTAATGEAASLQAFLAGAGLPPDLPLGGDASTLMRELGFAFRHTVQGLMNILRSRYEIKKTIGIRDLTTIGPRENNPLKTAPTADKAMRLLLGPRDPAYLPMAQALEESLSDIESHQMAMVTGMRDSLQYLLQRFDPETLAAYLGRSSLLSNVLPAYRKARYWDLYTILYAEIAKESEEDVWSIFGREFDRAYKEKISDKLEED